MKPISIVIITYNRPEDALVLLKNIAGQREAEALLESVIIINNASTISYSSVEDFIAGQTLPFKYVASAENLGVARGRNMAIGLAHAPMVVTLDDDAYFKDDKALINIQQFFSSDYAQENNTGVLCFKVLYASTLQVQPTAFPHKKIGQYRNRSRFLTSYYIGCGHAILKDVYNLAGIYPTDFFYGNEEYDLGYRILDLGYTIAYDDSIVVLHNESPLGRTPYPERMQQVWINKTKVAYRYLPYRYFISTAIMWSFEFLKRSFNVRLWLKGWGKILEIPKKEQRKPIGTNALNYIKKVGGRMWY
jgi:GT2 family glycosyltransferase